MSLKLNTKKSEPKEAEGLRDAGHVYLKCSNCQAYLMDFWRVRPHEPEVWKVKANCPFCDEAGIKVGGSFITEIRGGFAPAGYFRVDPSNPDRLIYSTKWTDSNTQGETIVFRVEKDAAESKAVRHG